MDTASLNTWCWATDEEGGYYGRHPTKDDALLEAFLENSDDDYVWVGKVIEVDVQNRIRGLSLLDQIVEDVQDEAPECCEGWLEALCKDKDKVSEFEKLVVDWIMANEPPHWYEVSEIEKVFKVDWEKDET